jgi:hypothetical protein
MFAQSLLDADFSVAQIRRMAVTNSSDWVE